MSLPRCVLVSVMPNKFPVPPTTPTKSRSALKSSVGPLAAFQGCYERYQDCIEFRDAALPASLREQVDSYILDFEIAAKRSLATESQQLRIFRMMFLENRTAEQCCTLMSIDRFSFASASRQMQSTVGDALIRRGLFPLNKYFTRGSAGSSSCPAALDRLVA